MPRIPVSLPFVFTLLLLAVPSTAVNAQSAQPPEGAAQEVLPIEAAAQPEADASAVASDPARPPDDYEASEQISEDLSVSFPVDI
jgi:hypothetical protein